MAEPMTAEAARLLVEQPPPDPEPVSLAWWTLGYLAGHDQGATLAEHRVRTELAEQIAELDRATFIEPGTLARDQRIAREVAADRCQIPVRQTDDWPPVTIPGTGNPAALLSEWPCRCPRDPRPCRPDCRLDHDRAGPGHHRVGYDLDGVPV